MTRQSSYNRDELLACARGELFGPGNPQLPMPPMLMFDRITTIEEAGGAYEKGYIEAELDIRPDLWFFECHFVDDPVMPGCLGLDALWQLLGFYLGWLGGVGRGRALGCSEFKFSGQVLPNVQRLTYSLDVKRIVMRRLIMGIADARVAADDTVIYQGKDLRVGLFSAPNPSSPIPSSDG